MEEMNEDLRQCFSTRNLTPDGTLKKLADKVLQKMEAGTKSGAMQFQLDCPSANSPNQNQHCSQPSIRGPLACVLQTNDSSIDPDHSTSIGGTVRFSNESKNCITKTNTKTKITSINVRSDQVLKRICDC